jgi:hypothetical protein
MNDYFDKNTIKINLIFDNEPFTKREAWKWLIDNSINGQLPCSIRYLANKWRWCKSKTERFIAKIKSESLIKTTIETGKLLIIIPNYERLTVKADDSETLYKTIARQSDNRDQNLKQNQDNNKCIQDLGNVSFAKNSRKDSGRKQDFFDNKQEKKKRTKKRKEERALKEKNIPFGNTKKEKCSQNIIPFELVEVSDVSQWVEEVLQAPIDLSWELEKFKDYWLSARKKPPKDGIAAFRNWLRTAIEINNKNRSKNDKFSNKTGERSTSFERFLAGGARAIARVSEHRLDRNDAW